MHAQWTPFHFTDIANELTDAKLVFAGSARYGQMQPVAWLTDAQAAVVAEIRDPMFAEEVRDYFCNRSFRSESSCAARRRSTTCACANTRSAFICGPT